MPRLLETGRRIRRRARADCRVDRHRYGSPQSIGGGITRRVCLACGSVTIDLTDAEWMAPAEELATVPSEEPSPTPTR